MACSFFLSRELQLRRVESCQFRGTFFSPHFRFLSIFSAAEGSCLFCGLRKKWKRISKHGTWNENGFRGTASSLFLAGSPDRFQSRFEPFTTTFMVIFCGKTFLRAGNTGFPQHSERGVIKVNDLAVYDRKNRDWAEISFRSRDPR